MSISRTLSSLSTPTVQLDSAFPEDRRGSPSGSSPVHILPNNTQDENKQLASCHVTVGASAFPSIAATTVTRLSAASPLPRDAAAGDFIFSADDKGADSSGADSSTERSVTGMRATLSIAPGTKPFYEIDTGRDVTDADMTALSASIRNILDGQISARAAEINKPRPEMWDVNPARLAVTATGGRVTLTLTEEGAEALRPLKKFFTIPAATITVEANRQKLTVHMAHKGSWALDKALKVARGTGTFSDAMRGIVTSAFGAPPRAGGAI